MVIECDFIQWELLHLFQTINRIPGQRNDGFVETASVIPLLGRMHSQNESSIWDAWDFLFQENIMASQPTPHLTYPHQKYGFNSRPY